MSRKNSPAAKLQMQLEELRRDLEAAKNVSIENVAAQIMEQGFSCLRCGECCTGEDNSVVVFPFEIRRIMDLTGEPWPDVAEPPKTGEWDFEGNFHTLEWRLKKKDGSCRFYTPHGCRIYEARPLLCMTYPFYLDHGVLCCSECRGLGGSTMPEQAEANELAIRLKERQIVEIKEAIALMEKYRDFERGRQSDGGLCIVHDSEGEHITCKR